METLEKNVELSETKRLDNIISSSRRKMMTVAGAAFAGIALAKFATPNASAQTTTLTDADYLNFALNLEYLEAQYYTLATSGVTIDNYSTPINIKGGASAAGTVTVKGNNNYASCMVPFTTPSVQAYANETAHEERNHVAFLSGALGGSAVPMPNIDLLNSFNNLAIYAGIGAAFDPFASEINFLLGSFIFEDVGVTAYTGAAAALTDPDNLTNAAGIQAVEAYHAGLVRTVLYGMDAASPSAGINATATKIANARAMLDGSSSSSTGADDIGLGNVTYANTGTGSTIVDADANSLVFVRTAAQVLSIVYAGGAAGTGGGFFPSALNGNVK